MKKVKSLLMDVYLPKLDAIDDASQNKINPYSVAATDIYSAKAEDSDIFMYYVTLTFLSGLELDYEFSELKDAETFVNRIGEVVNDM